MAWPNRAIVLTLGEVKSARICSDNQALFTNKSESGLPSDMPSTTIFKVRPATLRDAKTIAELHNSTARAAFQSLVGDVTLSLPPVERRQAFWREAIEYSEPQVLVALEDDQVVGFVGFDRSRDKGTPPTMGEIWAIYATPTFWGKGVGLALWDAAREGLQEEGCTHVTVWVPLASERAVRFHELAGFKRELNTAKTVPLGAIKVEEIRLKRALG
jgi:GNAT superfamily N-acetyltransferase